ncbi:MAG: magnesium transporter [Bdellovibrionales bacterium]
MVMETLAELDTTSVTSLVEHWSTLPLDARKEYFNRLPRTEAEELFLNLKGPDQFELLSELSPLEKRSWIRLLAPDDVADLIQLFELEQRQDALLLLDEQTRHEVSGLLAYAEDNAGGLMNPRYIRLRPDMTVEEAIRYIRAQARNPIEIIYYAYVLNALQQLKGVVSFRELFLAPPNRFVHEIMIKEVVSIDEKMDQEEVSRQFAQHEFMAMPVVDEEERMKGIVTVDDIVTVVEEEATEDIQKLGGTQALDAPYLKIGFREMFRKRGVWLTILFIGELFTASAMGYFEHHIQKAVILALFIPLIISSGGNSGSQASTLIIRALALRELQLRDWWRVLMRELAMGLALGTFLGVIGLMRVVLWPIKDAQYTEHFWLIGITVATSVIGVVLWGSLAGAMLPFVLRRFGLDPAAASAPLVATLVDVTGLVLYFSMASLILTGVLL